MVLLNIYQASVAVGGDSLIGTTSAVLQGPAVSEAVLHDNRDTTYWEIRGGLGQDQSEIINAFTLDPNDPAGSLSPSTALPLNAADLTVRLYTRTRNSATGCALSGFNSFAEVWGESSGGTQTFYTTVELTADFTDNLIDLPLRPAGTAWTTASIYTFPDKFGLRTRTECFSSTVPALMGVDWSEGHFELEFKLPTPVVTIGTVDAITPRGGTVYGTINPNQVFIGDNNGGYPLEYGFTLGAIQNLLPPFVYYGTVQGLTADIQVSHVYNNLSPGTTWFYKMAARDQDGNVTESAIRSFTTPLNDPLLGVY